MRGFRWTGAGGVRLWLWRAVTVVREAGAQGGGGEAVLHGSRAAAASGMPQCMIVVGRKGSELLTNEAGEVTSHLQGMLNRTIRMLQAGIKLGEPPDEEIAKRFIKKFGADIVVGLKKGGNDVIYLKHAFINLASC